MHGPSPRPLSRPARLALKAAVAAGVLLAGVLTVVTIDVNWRFAHLEAAAPARVFSAPFVITEGERIDRREVVSRLERLGYRKVEGVPAPGEYAARVGSLLVHLNAFDYPEGRTEERLLRVGTAFGRAGRLVDEQTGEALATARLEPEPIGTLSGDAREERVPVGIDEVPRALRDAVTSVEDRRFDRHLGVDLRGVGRALFANVRSGEVVQGGSTITQQLAKNLYAGEGSRTYVRKAWETLAAFGLEAVHSKDEILERYLNQIYLAQRGPTSILGAGAAARHYFGKEVRHLELPEAALLAGLIQSPGRYHPYRHPAQARERRNLVLRLMREQDLISRQEFMAAAAARLVLRNEPSQDPRQAPYFVDHVAQELRRLGLRDPASRLGLRVFTTLDPWLQARGQAALEAGLAAYEKQYRHLRRLPGGALQGALVALRAEDGAVLAMVGGRDYAVTQFNRVTQAHRQPGSLFKPFVYLTGFEKPAEEGAPAFTAATVLDDSPLVMEVSGKPWAPQNFDQEYRGPVSARRALALSLNVPTIRAAESIGLHDIVSTARRCGIESPLAPVPSIALGTFEVTPLEAAAAFLPFATLGWRVPPRTITAVVDDGGAVVHVPAPESERVVRAQSAYLTVDLMRDVVGYGTGAGVRSYGIEGDIAGKTGTTDDGRDAWFIGFDPQTVGLVWVGFDNNRPLRLGGSALALPIWARFAAETRRFGASRWREPDGLVREDVDTTTGMRAGWRCPESESELFIAGTEPGPCTEHQSPFESWTTRVFEWFRRD